MVTSEQLVELAREAGLAGRDWMEWTFEDAVSAAFTALGYEDFELWERAYRAGWLEWRRREWVVLWTTAPEDYDTFGACTYSHEGIYANRTLRRVLVDPRHVGYQRDKYASGLHMSSEEDPREVLRRYEESHKLEVERRALELRNREAGLAWLAGLTDSELDVVEYDACESHHIAYQDVRAERERRAGVRAEQERAAEWGRCVALVKEGSIIVDKGAPAVQGRYTVIPGRPSHVYYDVQIQDYWGQDPEKAQVVGNRGRTVGTLSDVAHALDIGEFCVLLPDEVPPEPVVRRIGHDRYKDIQRVELQGKVMWVGRPLFASEWLVLDAKGHVVRNASIRNTALQEALKLG